MDPIADLSSSTIAELASLDGRTAVVTGAARGLGYATAARLAEAGARVLIGDIDGAAATGAAQDIGRRWGAHVTGAHLDVSDADSIARLADRAVEDHGSIDIWVNNAGIFALAPALEMAVEDWDRVMDLNLRGTFLGAREAGGRMSAAGHGGVIVNMESIAAFRSGGPGAAAYVASKHGVRGLTVQLAMEFARRGIRVVGVAPGVTQTPGMDELTSDTARASGREPRGLALAPLGRVGLPDDVARVVLFCASDLAGFVTGCTVVVDGGALAR